MSQPSTVASFSSVLSISAQSIKFVERRENCLLEACDQGWIGERCNRGPVSLRWQLRPSRWMFEGLLQSTTPHPLYTCRWLLMLHLYRKALAKSTNAATCMCPQNSWLRSSWHVYHFNDRIETGCGVAKHSQASTDVPLYQDLLDFIEFKLLRPHAQQQRGYPEAINTSESHRARRLRLHLSLLPQVPLTAIV